MYYIIILAISLSVLLCSCSGANRNEISSIRYSNDPDLLLCQYFFWQHSGRNDGILINRSVVREILVEGDAKLESRDNLFEHGVMINARISGRYTITLNDGAKIILPDYFDMAARKEIVGIYIIKGMSDPKQSGQQVDSAEASTIAVPPSILSGSPR